jgi:iron complex outermembrane recepter protein
MDRDYRYAYRMCALSLRLRRQVRYAAKGSPALATLILLAGAWARAADMPGTPAPRVTNEANSATDGAAPPAGRPEARRRDLTESSLEELMNIEISSVSRKAQRLSQAAAAIYVITAEDIRRSGAETLPEVLRMAPGIDVERIDASKWAVSARGFNSRFSNKMLVLIDGRSVYTTLYSGVYWEQNDVILEDVERIEVIRGPGATMWGANAVNGVVNIITRKAADTQGLLVAGSAGTREPGGATMRFGGHAYGERIHYRIFGKAFKRSQFETADGRGGQDGWQQERGGFRVDWQASEKDFLTFQGDRYQGRNGQMDTTVPYFDLGTTTAERIFVSGGYASGLWRHRGSARSEFSLATSYSDEYRKELVGWGDCRMLDFDFQNRRSMGGRNELNWGLGFRRTMGVMGNGTMAHFNPSVRDDNIYSSFVQDEFTLVEDRLILTAGSKFQHNPYTGFEIQPSARLLWAPRKETSLWIAASRAVRTPSRRDMDLTMYFQQPLGNGMLATAALIGNPDFGSERVRAYEAGARRSFGDRVSVDVATFYNQYDDVQGAVMGTPVVSLSPLSVFVPVNIENEIYGETHGAEAALNWNARSNWRLTGVATALSIHLHNRLSPVFLPASTDEGASPQLQLRSSWDITRRLSLDGSIRHAPGFARMGVPGHVGLDLRLGWKVRQDLEVSLGGRDLAQERHLEYLPLDYVLSREVPRSAYLKVTWGQ